MRVLLDKVGTRSVLRVADGYDLNDLHGAVSFVGMLILRRWCRTIWPMVLRLRKSCSSIPACGLHTSLQHWAMRQNWRASGWC